MASLPALSFRAKLVAAMMVVVVGVTGSTLYVTQQRVQETYRNLFENQFKTQVASMTREQANRLGQICDQLVALSGNVRLIAAMEAGDTRRMYETAADELRDVIRPMGQGPGPRDRMLNLRRNAPVADRAMQATYLRLLDAEGNELIPPVREGPLARLVGPKMDQRKLPAATQQFYSRLLEEPEVQHIGYLTPSMENARVQLIEVVATKVIDSFSDSVMGVILMGFPVLNTSEEIMERMTGLRSGIWLDGALYSKSIPEEHNALVASKVGDVVQEAVKEGYAGFTGRFGTERFRVFVQALNPDSVFPTAFQVCLYSLESQFRDQKDLTVRIVFFGSVVLLGGLILCLLISHGFAAPVRDLVAGTEALQNGDFQYRVPVRSRDEIGRLAESFNLMAEDLALKEKYRSVLDMVADREVARQMMEGTVRLGGEDRVISVLFCDIRGFTALTHDMPPGEVIEMLNEHMTALTRVVYEHHGVVDKFVGDLIMAVFGAPKSYEQDAWNASRCALRMIEERVRLNQSSRFRIDVGIGVATGEAVAGCMGSEDRLNYTVLGRTVNLAARLCSKAGINEVVVDEATLAEVRQFAESEALPPMDLKGFDRPVPAHRLTALTSQPRENS